MTPRISELKNLLLEKQHHSLRHHVNWDLAERFASQNATRSTRCAAGLEAVLSAETPAFLPGERIAFIRTVENLPDLYMEAEMKRMREQNAFCELGREFNFTPDYASVISIGLDELRQRLLDAMNGADEEGREFLACGVRTVDAVLELSDRYCKAAEERGLTEIARTLSVVPHHAATTMLEALQFFRILHYTLWCEGEYHNGAGRLDLWLLPYYEHSIATGDLDEAGAFELLEEFFLSFNRDSDLYIGVQQGDNGQSMMLGGCDPQGNEVWNPISRMSLEASRELLLIDPKINLRVTRATPLERLVLGAELTKAGLGFPQYSNDDVVIPALLSMGYELEDARNYCVAACWEFVIPGVCRETVNLDAISIPAVLVKTLRQTIAETYDGFLDELAANLRQEAVALLERWKSLDCLPGIFASMLCPIAIRKARTISVAGKYHNWGVHGTGMAVAADSLTTIQELVFQRRTLTPAKLSDILDKNFEGDEELLSDIRNTMPKLGQNSQLADRSLQTIVKLWADAWRGLRNAHGGIVRPGTGSAMYYIWHSKDFQATPDGRRAGQPFPANFSPSLDVPVDGPLSVLRSFTMPDLIRVCNGGPLTIELHDSLFTAENATRSVGRLIAEFVRLGGHQLQLNSINRETLIDAQRHPERHRHLIVRVWGWSGYFVELSKEYQDHIIRRCEIGL